MNYTRNLIVIASISILLTTTACDKIAALNPMVPKDTSKYAGKMAALIANRPECQQYKDEIMSHATGKMTEGKRLPPSFRHTLTQ